MIKDKTKKVKEKKLKDNIISSNIFLIIGFSSIFIVLTIATFLPVLFNLEEPDIPTIDASKHNQLEFDDRVRGTNPSSKIDFIIFIDFKCAACIEDYPTIKKLIKDYPNVNFMYKHLVGKSQDLSFYGAKAYECARIQGEGLNLADYMFSNDYKKSDIEAQAESFGIDISPFKECINSNATERLILADANHGSFLEVKGTPTIFVNGIKIEGVHSYEVYSAFIDRELEN